MEKHSNLTTSLDQVIEKFNEKMKEEVDKIEDKKCLIELDVLINSISEYYSSCVEIVFEVAKTNIKESFKEHIDNKMGETLKSMEISLDKCYQHSEVKGARYSAFKEMKEILESI